MWFRLFMLGAGLLIGAAVIITIAETVNEFITKYNLPRLLRNALGKSNEQKVKEILGDVLNAQVKNLDKTTITIAVFEENGNEAVDVQLTGSGVSGLLQVGTSITG
ncbi:MAG: hypothetical protein MR828_12630 [Clostridiales bacterium]|nr:hypothetical protein [Clostridiales bacterium]